MDSCLRRNDTEKKPVMPAKAGIQERTNGFLLTQE